MKKAYMVVIALTFLFAATVAFAKPWGFKGQNTQITAEQQQFFDQTQELRKQMHDKRFELMELYRNPNSDNVKIAELENEINILKAKIQEKAKELKVTQGCGNCDNTSQGWNCPNYENSPGPRNCGNCQQSGPAGCGMMQGRMMRW